VTNLELPVIKIWDLYNGRADCENRIKELKQDFGLESFCLKDFWATEASFRWIMLGKETLTDIGFEKRNDCLLKQFENMKLYT
jgi:hypothetical protein